MDLSQNQIQPSQVPNPSHPHKWLVGVLIALSVIAVAIAAAYYFSDRMNNPQLNGNEGTFCTQEAKICPDGSAVGREGPNCEFAMCPGEIETSDWQTYHDEEFGFEFRYPKDYAIWENEYSPDPDWLQLRLTPLNSESIEIYAEENDHHCYEFLCDIDPKSHEIFNGITFDYLGSTSYGDAGESWTRANVYRYVHGDITIYITFDSKEQASQILSTFKFIETSTSTGPLFTRVNNGGLCPEGACHYETKVTMDGKFTSGNGASATLTVEELNHFKQIINTTDFEKIRAVPFTDICPAAYDGPWLIFTFYTTHGEERLDSCESLIDDTTEPFKIIEQLFNKYSALE